MSAIVLIVPVHEHGEGDGVWQTTQVDMNLHGGQVLQTLQVQVLAC